MNADVDAFIAKSTKWPDELAAMRPVLLAAGLTEEFKWRQPCYTDGGKNIVIMTEMNDALTLGFFKGTLLADPDGLLVDNGPNSRSVKRMFFRSVAEVEQLAATVTQYVNEAIAVERSGLKVGPAPEPEYADVLQARIDADPAFRDAFSTLTPGARREYNLYIGDAKQAATRQSRLDKCAPKILAGKRFRDR